MSGAGAHLAEFNWGLLRHDWDDPRVAEFVDALDSVNAAASAAEGFVWRLPDEDMEAAQTDPSSPLGAHPLLASTLSVWTDAMRLARFVWGRVHGPYLKRGGLWFEPGDGPRLVMWHVAKGHRPSVAEAAERRERLEAEGEGPVAFGWDFLRQSGQLGGVIA